MSTHRVTCLLQTPLPLSGGKIVLGEVNPHMEKKMALTAPLHYRQTSISFRKNRIMFLFYSRKHIS